MEKKLRQIEPPSSEITPQEQYLSRRDWLKLAGIASAGTLLAACAARLGVTPEAAVTASGVADELGDVANTFDAITHYNNYYEFTTDKEGVAGLAENFRASPWTVEVGGLVRNPGSYAIEDLLRFQQVERIYRMRCVEGWSMVIPWNGFELNQLLDLAEPMTSARYVSFTALLDEEQMPGQRNRNYPWPYNEGLRLDETQHSLTLLATGLYGQSLPNPNGAPLRLVVPWKYGYKSIKAIVRIDLTEEQPATLWNLIAPSEYGFYSNVNPQVDHPRWSQATERRIGETSRRATRMFNGYEAEVAGLYAGMDLRVDH